MNLDELENLLQELMQAVNQVVQSGEILSDEFQGVLAQTLDSLVTKIDEIKAQEQQGPHIGEPPSNDAQLLWMLAGQQEQAFISYLRNYPTQDTQALLANPSALSQAIGWLSQHMPKGYPENINGIQQADLNSSNIWGMAYNKKTGKMKVRFQGGSEYEYDGIPPNIFRAFQKGNASAKTNGKNQYGEWWKNKNPSLGASFNQYIKAGGFNYRKIK